MGVSPSDNNTIYSFASLESTKDEYSHTELINILQVGGTYYPDEQVMILYEHGTNHIVDRNPETGYPTAFETKIIAFTDELTILHETGHMIDPNINNDTMILNEAFAIAVSNHFDFKESIEMLRDYYEYSRPITIHEILQSVSTLPQPPKDIIERDYPLSAFFCYMYEELGGKKFMDVYGLLTGGKNSFYDNKTKPPTTYSPKGNLNETLKIVQQDIWQENIDLNIQEFLQKFISQVNS